MRLYLEVARRSFQRHLAYRTSTLAGLFTNSVFGVLIASAYLAFYRSREAGAETVAGFDTTGIVTYIWLGQSMIMVIYLWGWWEVASSIQTGAIVTDLMKPIDFYSFWLSRDFGRALCHTLTRMVPTLLIGGLLYHLAVPGSALHWLWFGISVALAVVVSFAFRFILNISAFWLIDIKGISYLALVAVNFFSGFLVPISFFPHWLRLVAELLPFRAIVMVPIEVALGQRAVAAGLALQLGWAVALSVLAQLILTRAVRKLEVQGG
jgi:ABC-2 type transport system permease protein